MDIERTNNARVARNTAMMYVRTLVTLFAQLVATRVVLQVLGVTDYGVYGVVGGIVVMLDFLNRSMSGATSRFLTFEMGQGNQAKLRETFNASLVSHIFIALLVLLLAETVGLWFLETKLIIPPERMVAARWVYQLSIATAVITIVQTPYNATIIAHEHMDVYAIIEIAKSVLMLVSVFVLKYLFIGLDKLILYALFIFVITLTTMAIYRFYCVKRYDEARFERRFSRKTIVPMLKFSLFDLYGNGCVSIRQYGINYLINNFFAVTYNATSTVATQVNGALLNLTSSVVQAFRPQIIKRYSIGDYDSMQRLMRNACRFSILLMACMATPLLLETDYVMLKWLGGEIPPQVQLFSRLLIIASIFGIVNSVVTSGIHATGRIMLLSLFGGTLFLLSVVVVWLVFRCNGAAYHAYTVAIATSVVILMSNIVILRVVMPQFQWLRFIWSIFSGLAPAVVCAALSWLVCGFLQPGMLRLILVALINFALLVVITWTFFINSETRERLLSYFQRLVKR